MTTSAPFRWLAAALGAAFLLAPTIAGAQTSADNNYFAYVAAESDDTVELVRFGPDGGELLRR
ncbi:MAG: hypothetical protein OXI45_14240, partial [Acidobacteriota bacterium]|nr:hypothetical protein [Acidobacteriota bacterium]